MRWKADSDRAASVATYTISLETPPGWSPRKHSAVHLFEFVKNGQPLTLKAEASQFQFDQNPTPQIHAADLAQGYVITNNATRSEWNAERLGEVQARGAEFFLARRHLGDDNVIVGFAIKGNTSVVVLVSGKIGEGKVPAAIEEFKQNLANVQFTPEKGQTVYHVADVDTAGLLRQKD